jgi:nucleoside-diphosphate-sugar epimerase
MLASVDAAPGAVYNVASARRTTLAELVERVRREFGVAAEPQWDRMPSRPGYGDLGRRSGAHRR